MYYSYVLPVVRIQPASDLKLLVAAMRKAAQAGYIQERPIYSKTEVEAILAAAPEAERLLSEGKTRILLVLPQNILACVVLTIDDFEGEPKTWHLSTSLPPLEIGPPPARVPDVLAARLAKAFETPDEGPPEGAFKNVRHFRGPYRPE